MKTNVILFTSLAVLLCNAVPGRVLDNDASTAQAQIEHVVERFQTAIIAHDKVALEGMFLAEGGSWFQVLGEEAYQQIKTKKPDLGRFHADSYQHFAEFVGASKQAVEEKFSNVRIQTDGAVASVYFDFAFLVDGKVNNVGSETWQLVNTGEGWKISAVAYSSYPDRAC